MRPRVAALWARPPGSTGQCWDSALALYHYRARWYDPVLGRFVQADTIVPEPGNPQALNRYSYVLNNPVRYSDPSGHEPCDGEPTCGHPRPPKPYSLAESNREARMLVWEWFSETGPESRAFGPDDSMTQDIMFSDSIAKFYHAWAEAGYPDEFEYAHTIEDNRSDLGNWLQAYVREHNEGFTAMELEAKGINVSPDSPYDMIGMTIGSYDTIRTSRYNESLIKIEVRNEMGWHSGLRVGPFAPAPDQGRSGIGPGGTTTQTFYWFMWHPAKTES